MFKLDSYRHSLPSFNYITTFKNSSLRFSLSSNFQLHFITLLLLTKKETKIHLMLNFTLQHARRYGGEEIYISTLS